MRSCREDRPDRSRTLKALSEVPSYYQGSVPRGARALVATEITGTRRHRPGRDWQNAATVLPLQIASVPTEGARWRPS